MSRIEELEKQAKEILEEIEKLKKEEILEFKKGDDYFFINANGSISNLTWNNTVWDNSLYSIGNCFKTREEAEKAVEKAKIYTQLKRLAEEISTEPIDWENENQRKYYIGYSHYHKEFLQGANWICQEAGIIYSTNKDFKDIALEHIGEENLLKLFKE